MESNETVTVEKEVYESVLRVNCNKIAECERLQKQLDIAVKALEEYADEKSWFLNDWEDREDCVFNGTNFYMEGGFEIAQKALKEIKNLIVAGRCTSVNEALWDVMSVIPCCAVTGQAAGLAAAMTDDFASLDVTELQKKLTQNGVVLHEQDLTLTTEC